MSFSSFAERSNNMISFFIFCRQSCHAVIWYITNIFYKVTDAITVYRISELNLGLHFVALRDSHLTHVVTKPAKFRSLPIVPTRGSPHPVINSHLNIYILPMADHHFSIQPHS